MEKFELSGHTFVYADNIFDHNYMVITQKHSYQFVRNVHIPLIGVQKIDLTYIDSLISRRKTNKMKIYKDMYVTVKYHHGDPYVGFWFYEKNCEVYGVNLSASDGMEWPQLVKLLPTLLYQMTTNHLWDH